MMIQFFIDPKSEYVFQSFKDATWCVETGYMGQYARKLKESDIEDDDSGNGKTMLCLDSVEKGSTNSTVTPFGGGSNSPRQNLLPMMKTRMNGADVVMVIKFRLLEY